MRGYADRLPCWGEPGCPPYGSWHRRSRQRRREWLHQSYRSCMARADPEGSKRYIDTRSGAPPSLRQEHLTAVSILRRAGTQAGPLRCGAQIYKWIANRRHLRQTTATGVRWQSGDAEDCKSLNAGSIPARTSRSAGLCLTFLGTAGFQHRSRGTARRNAIPGVGGHRSGISARGCRKRNCGGRRAGLYGPSCAAGRDRRRQQERAA